ncbi:MAG: adenylate/guanylate cyclase domain-containing protein [Ilumatobacter sp.]|uniref:adenylate/guanylate cyclase domain-containing protein n=1 Tax=Ilumatobacter sp. TaxID=1967498 RepID=UPI0032995D03
MHPVVEIKQPHQTTLYVSVRGPLVVGRECDGLLLADPQVSRRHLSLDVADGRVVVTDLGSTNGSTIDGRRLDRPTALGPGNVVRCGETTIVLDTLLDVTVRTGDAGRGTLVHGSIRAVDPGRTAVAGSDPGPGSPPNPPPPPVSSGAPRVDSSPGGSADPFPVQRPRPEAEGFRRSSIDIVAASAQDDGVDVRSLPVDQGTVTIVFSDIQSSTERNVELGDQAWFDVLAIHNRIVSNRVAQHGGTIIKNQGDGFMLSFGGARKALDCMMDVQRDLTAHSSQHPDRSVRIRIGMHTGEVLADADGDLFGQHVVVAARVANLAQGGEILVSSLSREIIASRGDIVFGAPRRVHLKGIGDATVFPMDWARL